MEARNPELKKELALLAETFNRMGLSGYQLEQKSVNFTDAEELELIKKIRKIRLELEPQTDTSDKSEN